MDGCLANLRTLIFAYYPSLTSLSLNIKHLTTLETLIIWDCEELRLMEGEENQDLELSLKKLMIGKLPKLGVLPPLALRICKHFTIGSDWILQKFNGFAGVAAMTEVTSNNWDC